MEGSRSRGCNSILLCQVEGNLSEYSDCARSPVCIVGVCVHAHDIYMECTLQLAMGLQLVALRLVRLLLGCGFTVLVVFMFISCHVVCEVA